MINDLITLPEFDNSTLGRKSRFWFQRLFEKISALAKYEGLPETVNRDYLETVLLSQGSIVWIKDKSGKLRALMGTHYGFDCYMFPTSTTIANPVLGQLNGTFGVNAVWMRNNIYAKPIFEIIKEYAVNLAQLDVDIKVNLDNLKLAKVFKAANNEQAKQIRELYKKIIMGEPAVISGNGNDWLSEENMEIFASDVTYYVDKLLADRRAIINDFLTQFGINNAAIEKKERLITSEIDINNQEIEINKQYWLEPRREALKEVNKLFGTTITVDWVMPETKDIITDSNFIEEDGENNV